MDKRAVVIGLFLVAAVGPAPARADVSPDAVRAAVARGVKRLLAAESTDDWEGTPRIEIYAEQKTGPTALAVDALPSAHVPASDPGVARAVAYLKFHSTTGVYALGLRLLVWQRLPPSADVKRAAKDDLAKLLADVGTRGEAAGMYGYYGPTRSSYSHSRTPSRGRRRPRRWDWTCRRRGGGRSRRAGSTTSRPTAAGATPSGTRPATPRPTA